MSTRTFLDDLIGFAGPPGPPGPPGPSNPLSNVWFVDQAAATDGDGSIAGPHNTLAAALTAHPSGGTFLLTPHDYSAETLSLPLANGNWSFCGLQLGSWPQGYQSAVAPTLGSLTLLPSLSIGSGGGSTTTQVALRSVTLPTLTVSQTCSLVLQDVVVAGVFSASPAAGVELRADRVYFDSSGVGGAGLGNADFNDCGFFGSQSVYTAGTICQLTRCWGTTGIVFSGSAGTVRYDSFTKGSLTVPVLTNGTSIVVGLPVQSITGATTQDQVDSLVAAGVTLGLWTDNR